MTDFLSRLVDRTLGRTPVVQPLIASRFAPSADVSGSDIPFIEGSQTEPSLADAPSFHSRGLHAQTHHEQALDTVSPVKPSQMSSTPVPAAGPEAEQTLLQGTRNLPAKALSSRTENRLRYEEPIRKLLPRPLPETERGEDTPFPRREGGRGVRFSDRHEVTPVSDTSGTVMHPGETQDATPPTYAMRRAKRDMGTMAQEATRMSEGAATAQETSPLVDRTVQHSENPLTVRPVERRDAEHKTHDVGRVMPEMRNVGRDAVHTKQELENRSRHEQPTTQTAATKQEVMASPAPVRTAQDLQVPRVAPLRSESIRLRSESFQPEGDVSRGQMDGPSRAMTPGATGNSHAAPTIRVTIGRIEVRAVSPPMPPVQQTKPPAPKMSLDDYLRSRNGGER